MTQGRDSRTATDTVTEVVARFQDRDHFEAAVKHLLGAGFAATDLSVLDTHESLASSEPPTESWRARLAGLTEEIKYVGPITTAGLIALAAGPVGAAVAGLVGAGVGFAAVREFGRNPGDAAQRGLRPGAGIRCRAAVGPRRDAGNPGPRRGGLARTWRPGRAHSHPPDPQARVGPLGAAPGPVPAGAAAGTRTGARSTSPAAARAPAPGSGTYRTAPCAALRISRRSRIRAT